MPFLQILGPKGAQNSVGGFGRQLGSTSRRVRGGGEGEEEYASSRRVDLTRLGTRGTADLGASHVPPRGWGRPFFSL